MLVADCLQRRGIMFVPAKDLIVKKYYLNFAGSGVVEEILASCDEDAVLLSQAMLAQADGIEPEDVTEASQWIEYGFNDEDQPLERLLFWQSAEEADTTAQPIGYLSRLQR